MILNSSQNIQSSRPLDSIPAKRVTNVSRSSSANPASNNPEEQKAQEKKAEQEQSRRETSVIRQLQARDREVRAHEAAHIAAGGSLVRGGPSFTLQRGPDGRSYAVGGEVTLDVSRASDPESTLRKSDQIRSAALAPAQPSPQDIRVAANASQMAARARIDIAIQRREEAALEQEQARLDKAQDEPRVAAVSESTEIDNTQFSNAVSIVPQVEPASVQSIANSASLQSEPPAAAISAFMATAETESVPVSFNQFI